MGIQKSPRPFLSKSKIVPCHFSQILALCSFSQIASVAPCVADCRLLIHVASDCFAGENGAAVLLSSGFPASCCVVSDGIQPFWFRALTFCLWVFDLQSCGTLVPSTKSAPQSQNFVPTLVVSFHLYFASPLANLSSSFSLFRSSIYWICVTSLVNNHMV